MREAGWGAGPRTTSVGGDGCDAGWDGQIFVRIAIGIKPFKWERLIHEWRNSAAAPGSRIKNARFAEGRSIHDINTDYQESRAKPSGRP
jgi:hypothetical protein